MSRMFGAVGKISIISLRALIYTGRNIQKVRAKHELSYYHTSKASTYMSYVAKFICLQCLLQCLPLFITSMKCLDFKTTLFVCNI